VQPAKSYRGSRYRRRPYRRAKLATLLAAVLALLAIPPVVLGTPSVCVFGCGPDARPSASVASPVASDARAPAAGGLPACPGPRNVRHEPPPPPGGGGPLALGQHASLRHLNGRALCIQAQRAREAGARYVRENLSWATVEPRRGRFDWRRPDEVVGAAAQYGLTVLPLLVDAPRWSGGSSRSLPTDQGAFARFTARAAARYGPGGTFWRAHRSLPQRPARYMELFNEPYLPSYSGGHPDPGHYARLVAAAVPAARAANPQARFLIEVDTTYSPNDGATPLDWLTGMYAAVPDLGSYFDAVAVHPYANGSPLTYTPGAGDRWQSRRIERIHDALVARGAGDKHLWVTEVGWATCRRAGECVSESRQAAYLRDLFALRRVMWRGYVDAVFVYALQDYRSSDGSGSFGLLRQDGSRKPAWYAMRAAAPRV
jgi:hypothetical protein